MATNLIRAAALICGVCFIFPPAHAAGQARALYQNVSSPVPSPAVTPTQNINPGLLPYSGYIKAGQAQSGGAAVLDECGFGQPFSQWFPTENYGEEIRTQVIAALYPGDTVTTRTGIVNSGKPLRYKFLLYDGTGTDVTAFDPASLATWYTGADRAAIIAQINFLKAAVAASPLDLGLRELLLDVYYDLAVAEMQAAKPRLAELAKFRIGISLPPVGQFAIDKEIDTYEMIDDAFKDAIAQYADLLSVPFPDIDPSSFDPDAIVGTPMGQYIFRREQKRRDTMAAQFVGSNGGGLQVVPDVNALNQAVARPPGEPLFNGYKDLNALLDLIGQRQRHLAALCTLRGTRNDDGDLAFARMAIAEATGVNATDLQLIQSWFPEIFPPDPAALPPSELAAVKTLQQEAGVLSALSTIKAGRVDLLSVLPFLNGSANSLGYDPNFLLLVQGSAGPGGVPKDTYDTLRDMLQGNNKPLTVALEKLRGPAGSNPPQGARGLYTNFQEKADRVAADIENEDLTLDTRYFDITGFRLTDDPNFDPQSPNPKIGSELAQVLNTINALNDRQTTRKQLSDNFDDLLAEGTGMSKAGYAKQLVGLAEGKEQVLKDAVTRYRGTTTPLYDSTTNAKVLSATSQAAFDTVSAAAGTGEPIAAGFTAAAGVANIAIQASTTRTIAENEKNIDFAGIQFSADLEGSDAAIAINQARLDLAALNREQLSNTLDTNADVAEMTQASAQQARLMAELARIVAVREENVTAVRKKSYASPLHYHRAEAALLDADQSFRTAQRWMFYTIQALNYKWQGSFAVDVGSKRYDTSTLFKCRNAEELNDLLTQMENWNAVRETQTSSSPLIFSRISLRDHILARNPNRFDTVNPSDPGVRVDDTATPVPTTLTSVPTDLYFQRLLKAKYSETNGDIVIPFSTAFGNQIVDRIDGNFFRGASYNAAGTITDKGFWREKLHYIKVNIVAPGNGTATTQSYSANLVYGGTTYFHTRVPPRGDRSISGLAIDDARGELLVAPFRRWVSPDFDENFVAETEQLASIPIGYSRSSAVIQGTGGIQDNLGTNFQVNDFFGRSIAATGWRLIIPSINNGGFVIDPDNITDIELLIAYKHSARE